MIPLLAAGIGAAGSIASGFMGAQAQEDNMLWNWYINQENQRQRRKEITEARDYAEGIRDEQKLGATDALGNTSRFVEGKGWVSTLSPEQQRLYDHFFKQELPERQAQFARGADRSRATSDQADALLGEFQRVTKQSPKEAEALLYSIASRGIGEGARDASETAMRQGMRTGNSNIADIIGSIGQQTMKARGDARVNSAVQAKDHTNSQFAQERGSLAQLFQMFAGKADQPLGASYDPSGIPQSANSLMNVFSNQAQQGNSMGAQAMQMQGLRLNELPVNDGWANAIGGAGAAISGLGDRIGAMGDKNDMNALLRQYISQGGQIDFGGGGIMASMTDRVRANGVGF